MAAPVFCLACGRAPGEVTIVMHEGHVEAGGDYVAQNREAWDRFAPDYVEAGRRNWATDVPTWGIFGVPEEQVDLLPEDLRGKDAIELGCGTGYVSAWLAKRGVRPVGIDNSPAQLETARRFQQEFGITFPLHLGNAEQTPFPDASFDFAISEYGAAIWCDPYRWIPEAARILRPGGRLHFLGNSTLLMLTTADDDGEAPVTEKLERPLFGMHRFAWHDGSVEFHIPHGEMIRLLRSSGFEVEDLIEVQIPEDATTRYPYVTPEWARRWPCEEIWKARRVVSRESIANSQQPTANSQQPTARSRSPITTIRVQGRDDTL